MTDLNKLREGVTFTVYGDPQQKGSTRAFAIPIKGTVGAGGKGPKYRAVTTSANPNLKRWESTIAAEAQIARRKYPEKFFEQAVAIQLDFFLLRPASVTVKARPYPTVMPDLDKLVRGSVDPLKGIFFRDDAQVIHIVAFKRYTEAGAPHLIVSIWPLAAGSL